ncbi:MAG: tRNA threonylcarbamoyladenosine biosynthesis protein RimN [Gammaproteobacteria bacterium]|nr:MAG: tRNA threonylcarbamoyladenosine biosynthesis protein RimN [Gammaproteobacteria bacterium]
MNRFSAHTHWHLIRAAGVVRAGGVIAYPTEAVWGLGCDPWQRDAVMKILALKQRPIDKGVILISGQISHFERLLRPLPRETRETIRASWPDAVTWIVPDHTLPHWIRGAHASVAIRVTAHPLVAALTRRLGHPIVSTSANPSTLPEARTLKQAQSYFGRGVDAYLPGETLGLDSPSRIMDSVTGQRLR